MIIVSGRLFVSPGRREAFLAAVRDAVVMAWRVPGCRDLVVAADPIEPDRVKLAASGPA
jgi:quinol monooxygenase YgiN